ncbi:hypothetical protein QAD02_015789 [Eretmocerus hayati]|uniref:Uncharacterized protein n=1 Tax=Eretmocerus hayati TaxID=131215 RepID=A0ACC2P9M4_9HYME|nr:hypothetical protein QAD02_015789 [Eretmocerus hayati]
MKKGGSAKKIKGYAALSIAKAYGRDKTFHTTLPLAFVSPNDKILEEMCHSAKFLAGPMTDDDYDLVFSMAKFEGSKPPAAWLDTPATVHQFFKTYDESQDFLKKLAAAGTINETRFGPRTVASLLETVTTPTAIRAMPVFNIQNCPTQQFSIPLTSQSSELAHFVQSYMPDIDGSTSELITIHQGEAINPTEDVTGAELMPIYQIDGTSSTLSKSDITGFETRVMEKLSAQDLKLAAVEGKLSVLQKQIDDQTAYFGNENPPASLTGITTLTKKYEFDVPFSNLELFLKFDEKLVGEMFEELKTYLMITHLKAVTPTANCYKLFHFFFTKEVLANCTPVQKNGEKAVFKKTKSYRCLLEAFTSLYHQSKFEFSDDTLTGFVKSVIKNIGDWGKGRIMRTKSESECDATDNGSPAEKQRLSQDSEQQTRSPLKVIPHNLQD